MAVLSPENMYYLDVLDDITNTYLGPTPYQSSYADESWESLRSKNPTLKEVGRGKHRKYKPKAFTERGRSYQGRVSKNGI